MMHYTEGEVIEREIQKEKQNDQEEEEEKDVKTQIIHEHERVSLLSLAIFKISIMKHRDLL